MKFNLGGRPRKDIKRVKQVGIKYTRIEHILINSKAKQCKMKPATMIRELSLNKEVKVVFVSDQDRKLTISLIGFCNNINVLAKHSYSQQMFTLADDLNALMEKVNIQINKMEHPL